MLAKSETRETMKKTRPLTWFTVIDGTTGKGNESLGQKPDEKNKKWRENSSDAKMSIKGEKKMNDLDDLVVSFFIFAVFAAWISMFAAGIYQAIKYRRFGRGSLTAFNGQHFGAGAGKSGMPYALAAAGATDAMGHGIGSSHAGDDWLNSAAFSSTLDGHDWLDSPSCNINGLPMCGGVDIQGNPFGVAGD